MNKLLLILGLGISSLSFVHSGNLSEDMGALSYEEFFMGKDVPVSSMGYEVFEVPESVVQNLAQRLDTETGSESDTDYQSYDDEVDDQD